MMGGMSALLLLAASCTQFEGVSGPADSGPSDSGPSDSGADTSTKAGIVLVREGANTASGITKLTVTLPTPPADGHALILVVGANMSYPSGVTGGGVANWTKAVQSGEHIATSIWVGLGVSGATSEVTITWPDSQPTAGALLTEWAGLTAFDRAGAIDKGSNTMPTVVPFAAQPGQLLFAAAGTQSTASTPTSGFTAIDSVASSGSVTVVGAYLSTVSAGSYGTSWTMSSPAGWDTMLVALR